MPQARKKKPPAVDPVQAGATADAILALLAECEHADGAVAPRWHAELAGRIASLPADGLVAQVAERVMLVRSSLHRADRPWRSKAFTPAEARRVQRFLVRANRPAFAKQLLASAYRHGHLEVEHPLGGGAATCNTSFTGGSVVFLRFQGAGEPFYVVQHNFACEAVYFPLRTCMVHLDDCLLPDAKMRRLLSRQLREPAAAARHLADRDKRWGGLLVSNESPYHYFYFQVPGVVISAFDRTEVPPAVHAIASGHFLDVASTYALGSGTTVHADPQALHQHLVDTGTFVFSLGLRPWQWLAPHRIRLVDGAIVAMHAQARPATGGELTVWVGVSAGKRAWPGELDAIAQVLARLAGRVPRLRVLADGWTSSLAGGDAPKLYTADAEMVESLRARLPANARLDSLVGLDPVRKLECAAATDFFVCSHATASIYVSRMLGKPGVTHISNVARDAAIRGHWHPRAKLVPAGLVTDLGTGDSSNMFRVDYDIDPTAFADFAMEVAQAAGVVDAR